MGEGPLPWRRSLPRVRLKLNSPAFCLESGFRYKPMDGPIGLPRELKNENPS